MASSIERLYETIKDPEQDVSDLMAQASVLARVLHQRKVIDWHKKEQEGYGPNDPLPDYRQALEGHLVTWMPANGWVQAPISDEFEHEVARRDILMSFRDVAERLEATRKAGGERIDYSDEEMKAIQAKINHDAKLAFAMPSKAYAQVIESCRALLRLWVEDLIAAGISGSGMKFSDEEKDLADGLDEKMPLYFAQATEIGKSNAAAAAKRPSLLSRLFGT